MRWVLRIKTFNIMGVHWKIRILGGEGESTKKTINRCLKSGAWTVSRFKRGLRKKEGVNIYLGSHIPVSIYSKTTTYSLDNKIINTSVFMRRHIILVFFAFFCTLIHCYSLFCFIHCLVWFWLYIPLDINMLKIH